MAEIDEDSSKRWRRCYLYF